MAYCEHCGSKLDEGAAFCQNCGAKIEGAASSAGSTSSQKSGSSESSFTETVNEFAEKAAALNETPNTTSEFSPEDISSHKLMGVLAYLGLLWLIPFLAAKDSPFVKFHLNQGIWVMLLFLLGIIIPLIGFIPRICGIVLMILGIINVCNGQAKELPLVGGIHLLN